MTNDGEEETDDYRVVKLFNHDKRRRNAIQTNKYTWYDFVPKNLFEQFSQLGNMYFLLVAVGQLFPSISNTKGRPATLVPLSGVVAMQAVKDLFEDWQRIASDQKENSNLATMVDADLSESSVEWGQIRPGMVLKIRNEERIPADCLLLTSSNADGHCSVETANLDGETNLKKKTSALTTAEFEDAAQNVRCIGAGAAPCLRCEPPSGDVYAFRSSLELSSGEVRGLGVSTLLLRGTSLQQTEWVLGMVVYAGHDTRTLKNSRSARFKPSALDVRLNGVVAMIFAVQMSICFFISLSSFLWQSLHGHQVWYLEGVPQYLNPLRQVGIWFLMLNSMVPISLMITVTVVKFAQGKIMSQDPGCGSNGKSAEVHTSQVIDSLGQVTHVFSDKTGTLTQNVMEYRACSVGGRMYGLENNPADEMLLQDAHVNLPAGPFLQDLAAAGPHSGVMASFVLCHALCHTVEPADGKNSDAPYNASSPDELALVCAARAIGSEFVRLSLEGFMEVSNRGAVVEPLRSVAGWTPDEGTLLKARLLDVCEFDNNRKRMSVVVRLPNGHIMLYTKGADSSILPFLTDAEVTAERRLCEEHLTIFARQGLRTLCLAERQVSEEEHAEWHKRYEAAKALVTEDKADKVHELVVELETNQPLHLLGATAIEDRLQDEVPETIEQLRAAGIRVWVLTGDKVDTAISIAMSCQLLTDDMDNFVIDLDSEQSLYEVLTEALNSDQPALTISGGRLAEALESEEDRALLFKVGQRCRSVVCCRVSPKQKADVVDLVKSLDQSAVTLSIGDGANDVSMIVAAHVGIGLSGKEGAQAAYAADFALPEFRLLKRSIFAHGREAYRRNAVVCLYSFYKNQVNVLITIFAAAGNAFSGSNVVSPWLMQCYNLVHCHVPLFLYGMYDRATPNLADLADDPSGHGPNLFGYDIQLIWMAAAALQASLIRALWSSSMVGPAGETGPDLSQSSLLGNLCFVSVVLCVNVTLMFRQYSWSVWIILTYVFNFLGLLITLILFVPGLSQIVDGTNFLRVCLVSIVTLVLTTVIGEILIQAADMFMSGTDDEEEAEKSGHQVVHVLPAAEPLQPSQSLPMPPDLEMSRKGSSTSRISARRSSFGFAYSEECSLEREKERWSYMSAPPQVYHSATAPMVLNQSRQSSVGASSKELQPDTAIELTSFRG